MLLALTLDDFVIVDHLDLDFQPGFTVLTGETGAGKSITLDAIGLLLGDKADYAQVRSGAKEARLSALFDLSGLPDLQSDLAAQGLIEENAAELTIRRIIDAKGKSRSYINGQAATLAQLKSIGSRLIDIHGQHAHQSLNREAVQRELLDAYAGCTELAAEVKTAYRSRQAALEALRTAREEGEQLQTERERLEWQAGELDRLAPLPGEWESLSRSHDSLAHAAELIRAAQEAEETINGEQGLQYHVYRCRKTLESLSHLEPRFAESVELLTSVEAELEEAAAAVRSVAYRTELDPAELAAKEERMGELMSAARKYRIEPQELPAKLAETADALGRLEAAADTEALEAAVQKCEQAYMQTAEQLSAHRRQAAARLGEETTAYMQKLAMKGAEFAVALQAAPPSAHGLEQVQYQVSANQGSPLRPLDKVASGGELARISLSLQVAASRHTAIPTLIFDEVDTGIGGGVAETVGRALAALGQQRQVLAVTHLPQVAACGRNHWQVSKNSDGTQTLSSIRVLDGDSRTGEIARMLGGETITDTTRRHAAEMLENAQKA
ncbi:Recombination protein N [Kingella potus]|uniref:DNA repair protein RecN n=1 Tax=Kingella potus TaxID=265175 RepID=A0A377R4X4_9NEIS|nr:DNA repair protein RecN [Kingella potus]STR03294.1 Recombination protein N [Kingella potus]